MKTKFYEKALFFDKINFRNWIKLKCTLLSIAFNNFDIWQKLFWKSLIKLEYFKFNVNATVYA